MTLIISKIIAFFARMCFKNCLMELFEFSPSGVILGLILVTGWGVLFLLYQIIKQQGRLLLRLDGIERHLGILAPPPMPAGLAPGKTFPPFRLPDLGGREVGLETFRGKRVLLVNWSPQCGFCIRIAPELAKLQQALFARNVELVLASFGDAAANRKLAAETSLKGLFLLQKGGSEIKPFQGLGTPVAYLLDENGRVAKTLAVGADLVPLLARYAAGLASEAELARKRIRQAGHLRRGCGTQGRGAKNRGNRRRGAGYRTEKIAREIGNGGDARLPLRRPRRLDGSIWLRLVREKFRHHRLVDAGRVSEARGHFY
jgi:thiol-disulfide isomerase/thioredoxin